MKECDSQISGILKEQQKLQHKLSEEKLERKRLENEVFLLFPCVNFYYNLLHNIYFSNCLIGKTNGDGTKRLLYKG